MGHVDHADSLLDASAPRRWPSAVRCITQHIGAYQVDTSHGKVTFLDTPGHEAFTRDARPRAQATDMVSWSSRPTNGVMPQTVEAINHARRPTCRSWSR